MTVVDFADVYLLVRAAMAGKRTIEDSTASIETWRATTHGIALTVHFDHPADRWTITGTSPDNTWTMTFVFDIERPLPAQTHLMRFGRPGRVSQESLTNPDAYRRHVTMLKVFLPAVAPKYGHGTMPFTVA